MHRAGAAQAHVAVASIVCDSMGDPMTRSSGLIGLALMFAYTLASAAAFPPTERKWIAGATLVTYRNKPVAPDDAVCQDNDPANSMCSAGGLAEHWTFDWVFVALNGVSGGAAVTLQRIEGFGYEECSLTIAGRTTRSLQCSAGVLLVGPAGVGVAGVDKVALLPLLDDMLKPGPTLATCVHVTSPAASGLDEDIRQTGNDQYAAATAAFQQQYRGQLVAIAHGNRVDVKYPTGSIVTFKVTEAVSPKALMNPYFKGFGMRSPCEQETASDSGQHPPPRAWYLGRDSNPYACDSGRF